MFKTQDDIGWTLAAYANAFHARALDATALAAITVVVAALPLRARLRLRREGVVTGVARRTIIVVLQGF